MAIRRRLSIGCFFFGLLLLLCGKNTNGWKCPTRVLSRRRCLATVPERTFAAIFVLANQNVSPAHARAFVFDKKTDQFQYELELPENSIESGKPVKTHLDEANFKTDAINIGVTVDPVRIPSLADFGTPQEVAAKVVLAEVNRDGVFQVKLMEDPIVGTKDDYYQLNYLSMGKRGDKRNLAKFFIVNKFLFCLTVTCKEEFYEASKATMMQVVDSFRVLS